MVRRSGSEVTLSANVEGHGVLVLEHINRRRLRSSRGRERRTGELLVEGGPHDFGRERQVLDRSPAGHDADLGDVEVRVTAEVDGLCTETTSTGDKRVTEEQLRGTVVTNGRVAAEQARRPVRIPVVVERTTDTVSGRQMEVSISTIYH